MLKDSGIAQALNFVERAFSQYEQLANVSKWPQSFPPENAANFSL